MLTTTFFLIVVVILGCFASFIINIITFDDDKSLVNKPPDDDMIIADGLDHLTWFMQISDIHISVHFDLNRKEDLKTFCTQVVDAVKPAVVIASGDLTDSRTLSPFGSDQIEQEWIWYWEVLNSSRVTEKTVWLDLRGNHDAFNVHSWNSSNNYFKKYSMLGPTNKKHYVYTLKSGNDLYKFVAIDATLAPSPKRPYNFIGHIRETDISTIKKLINDSPSANLSIWFGHYPTSSIFDESFHLHDVIDGPYLCGHFHTIGGLVRHMYATQRTGYLEIEVADWKDERMFRVASIDHGLFTFNDVKLNEWPIIIVTNPKPALFMMLKHEPYHRISTSTHIRTLVFSPYKIKGVQFKIGKGQWQDMSLVSDSSLYVHPWDPDNYKKGLHEISVRSTDEHGNEHLVSHQFSLDGTKPEFSFGSRLVLRTPTRTFLQSLFLFVCILALFPLLVMRVMYYYDKGKIIRIRAKSSPMYKIHHKLYLISSIDKFFFGMVLIPVYDVVGPWFVGDALDGHWGIYFAYGAYIDGAWVPAGLPYLFGFISMLFFHFPIMFCLAHAVDCQYSDLCLRKKDKQEKSLGRKLARPRHFVFGFIILCYIVFSQSFWIAYGVKSLIFGFERFWSLVIYLALYSATFRLTPASFPNSIKERS